jgi:hypothetical protein
MGSGSYTSALEGSFKGTVARDFLVSVFYGSALYGPQISRLKGFSFLFRFREVIRIFQ